MVAGPDNENSTVPPTSDETANKPRVTVEQELSADEWKTKHASFSKLPIDDARDSYQKLLRQFPNAGKFWVEYAQKELDAQNVTRVEEILKKTLLSTSNMWIWKFYLKFIKQTKLDKAISTNDEKTIEQARDAMLEAYEFAIEHVGFAMDSSSIWTEYIDFLKETKADTDFAKSRKMTALRRLYQRAVVVPTPEIDSIWRAYEVFENSMNKTTATTLLGEHQQPYMQARTLYRDRKALWDGVGVDALPQPYRGTPQEVTQLNKWRAIIASEMESTNQLADKQQMKKRVRYVYEQALAAMTYYPELWYEFASFEQATGDVKSAELIYQRALKFNPESLYLRFVVADFEEARPNMGEAKKQYEFMMKAHPIPVVFIQYQRFARRSEGIQASRDVFKRARMHPSCSASVYQSAALLEYRMNKEADVARNIFELGLRRFHGDVEYVVEYLRFVMAQNDDNDTRALFQRALKMIPPNETEPVWLLYRDFETNWAASCDLSLISRCEHLMAKSVPNQAALRGMVGSMHRYMGHAARSNTDADTGLLKRNESLLREVNKSVSVIRIVQQSPGSSSKAMTGKQSPAEPAYEVPAFLKKFDLMLPQVPRGVPPNVDFVFNTLRDMQLPATRPADTSVGGKRKAGDMSASSSNGEANCAFRLRQELNKSS